MTACSSITFAKAQSVSQMLLAVDCESKAKVEIGFQHLFGNGGDLQTVLTLILTLYVAIFGFDLLLGRSRLNVNIMTPKMLKLGVILTLSTSWVAYQETVWRILVEAPDEIATAITGSEISATYDFAKKFDLMFTSLTESAQDAQSANSVIPPPGSLTPQLAGTPARPADLLWLSSLVLLLGTIGVLVASKVALCILLVVGPIFIVLGLFESTRGLFEGWLKASVSIAIAPILSLLLGNGVLNAIEPVIDRLASNSRGPSLEIALSVLLATFVYICLLWLSAKAARTIVSGWTFFGERQRTSGMGNSAPDGASIEFATRSFIQDRGGHDSDPIRMRQIVAASAHDPGSHEIHNAVPFQSLANIELAALPIQPLPPAALANGRDPRITAVSRSTHRQKEA